MSNANRPAFPVTDAKAPPSEFEWVQGLSKREYIAAMAMQGYLAMYSGPDVTSPPADRTAQQSVRYADALLAELAKEPQS